jgi:hypothetical protein
MHIEQFVREAAESPSPWLSIVAVKRIDWPRSLRLVSKKPFIFNCRERDSNPHGAFAPEDFKSCDYTEKLFVLLALFPSNVKVCKFLCKY